MDGCNERKPQDFFCIPVPTSFHFALRNSFKLSQELLPSLHQKIDIIKMAAEIRLTKELKEVSKDDKTSGVKAVALEGGNNRLLLGTLSGPSGTPYEGGIFEVDISIPQQYPFEPPKMVSFTLIISWDKRRIILDLLSSSRSFCRDGISNIKIMFMYIFIISRFELPYIMFVLSHMFICNSPQSQSYTVPFIKSNQIKSNQSISRNLLQKYGTRISHPKPAQSA